MESKLAHLQLGMIKEQDRAAQAERDRAEALAERDAARAAQAAHASQMAQAHTQMQAETIQQLESLQVLQRAVGMLTEGERVSQEANAQLARRVRVLDGERVDLELKCQVLQQQLEMEQGALRAERTATRSWQDNLTDVSRQLDAAMLKSEAAERQIAVMEPELAHLRKLVYGVAGGGRGQLHSKDRKEATKHRGETTITQALAGAAPRCHRCKRLDRC